MKKIIENIFRGGKGAIKGILHEFGIVEPEKQEKFINELSNIINIDIKNEAHSQVITNNNSGKNIDEYVEEMLNWRKSYNEEIINLRNCRIEINNLKEIINLRDLYWDDYIKQIVSKVKNNKVKLSEEDEWNKNYNPDNNNPSSYVFLRNTTTLYKYEKNSDRGKILRKIEWGENFIKSLDKEKNVFTSEKYKIIFDKKIIEVSKHLEKNKIALKSLKNKI